MKRRILTIGLALAICLCGYAFIYGEESSKVDTEANTNQKEQTVEVKENAKPELSEEDMVDNTKEALEFNVEEPTAEEFNKDGKAPLLKSPAETRRNEWVTENGEKYYLDENGEKVKGVYAIDGTIYYFDPETGAQIVRTGWIDWSMHRYFSNATGELYHDMIITFGRDWYYMGSDGSAQIGIVKASNGNIYYADETGLIRKETGWIEENGKRYFSNASGELYHDMIITFGRDWYYMGADGAAMTGSFTTKDGRIFEADETGLIDRNVGWKERDGKRYFYSDTGELYRNRIITFGRDWYYMGDDGAAMTGTFTTKDGRLFEADETGLIKRNVGWKEINGKRYFYNDSSELYRNMMITFGKDRYYMGADGAAMTGMFKASNGNIYYADETGLIGHEAGWIEENGKRYFSNANGEIYRNRFITFGEKKYYMGDDGSVQSGIINVGGENYYADPNNDDLIVTTPGWLEVNGTKYFVSPGGSFYHNRFITFGDVAYYLNTDGTVVKTAFNINGVGIRPDPETGEIPISQYNNYMGSFNNTPYSTVVIIEIGRQVLKYFRNGELLLYCDVVTGNPHGWSTPKGTYSILRKTPGTYLVGADYRVWVDYWMPFIRNEYGIHDSNRPVNTFGGNTYFHRGSHGCVNLPKWAAARLYSLVSVGTRVVIR